MAMSPRLLRPLASGFNPKKFTGLAAWYDASVASSITLNSTTVSQWDDLSGNSRHQVQASASLQPTYNATGLNGKGALTTTGTQWMQASAFATPAAGEYTAFSVLKFDILTGQPYAFQRGGVNDAHSLLIATANTWNARRGSGNAGTLNLTVNQSEWYLVTTVFTPTLARVYVGTTQGTDNTASVSAPTGNKVLFLFGLSSTTLGGRPGFAEFIYYHARLSATEIAAVQSYLQKKWAV